MIVFFSALFFIFAKSVVFAQEGPVTPCLFFSDVDVGRVNNYYTVKQKKSIIKNACGSTTETCDFSEEEDHFKKNDRYKNNDDDRPLEEIKKDFVLEGIIKDGDWWTIWIDGVELSSDGLCAIHHYAVEEVQDTRVLLLGPEGKRVVLHLQEQKEGTAGAKQTPFALSKQDERKGHSDSQSQFQNKQKNFESNKNRAYDNMSPLKPQDSWSSDNKNAGEIKKIPGGKIIDVTYDREGPENFRDEASQDFDDKSQK